MRITMANVCEPDQPMLWRQPPIPTALGSQIQKSTCQALLAGVGLRTPGDPHQRASASTSWDPEARKVLEGQMRSFLDLCVRPPGVRPLTDLARSMFAGPAVAAVTPDALVPEESNLLLTACRYRRSWSDPRGIAAPCRPPARRLGASPRRSHRLPARPAIPSSSWRAHGTPTPESAAPLQRASRRIPVPDSRREPRRRASCSRHSPKADAEDGIVVLLSGGSSALLASPCQRPISERGGPPITGALLGAGGADSRAERRAKTPARGRPAAVSPVRALRRS